MWNLKACVVCFSTDGKLYNLSEGNTRELFNLVSGVKTGPANDMPDYLCVECHAYVRKFTKFRDKCQRAYYALEYMLSKNNEIRLTDLQAINRRELKILPNLSYIDLAKACHHYEQVTFKFLKTSRAQVLPIEYIPVQHYSVLTSEDTFKYAMTDISLETDTKNDIKTENNFSHNFTFESDTINVDNAMNNMDDNMVYLDEKSIQSSDNENDNNEMLGNSSKEADGSNLNEEYANLVPISVTEAKAVMEIKKKFMKGSFICECGWSTNKKEALSLHQRMHNRHVSGTFRCEICDYYYKTMFLLHTHMSDKHMYKYICQKCPEVSFDRTSAKIHYVRSHMKTNGNWVVNKPDWLAKRTPRLPVPTTKRYNKGVKKVPEEFLTFTPIKHEEQYTLLEQRKQSRNYLHAKYKCELCYRAFRVISTFNRHMNKHDPEISGNLQCDICKVYFGDTRKMYKHMNMNHLTKYSCKICDYVTPNRNQALMHYKWHKNVTYDCPHCDRKFLRISTQLTHIRIKHPSTTICNICGHSFVSLHGLTYHKQISHRKEEVELSESPLHSRDSNYCVDCGIQFMNETAYVTHLASSGKHVVTNLATTQSCRDKSKRIRAENRKNLHPNGRKRRQRSEILNIGITTANNCEVCGINLPNDVQARRHYEAQHPGTDYLKRYMCDVCGHATKQYANLVCHMRKHTLEKPFKCPHCDKQFSMQSNRDRHIVVHTGEKRYQCHQCSRRFTQSSAVKLHIQTVHMKIPYAPWDKKKRKRRKEMEPCTDINIVAPQACIVQTLPEHKTLMDPQAEYINAYINYADE